MVLPDCTSGWRQRRAKRPDVLLVLLHCGNADFKRGNVGQKWARGWRWLLFLSVLLSIQEGHELDLDHGAGKAKHAPRKEDRKERRWWEATGQTRGNKQAIICLFSQQNNTTKECQTALTWFETSLLLSKSCRHTNNLIDVSLNHNTSYL